MEKGDRKVFYCTFKNVSKKNQLENDLLNLLSITPAAPVKTENVATEVSNKQPVIPKSELNLESCKKSKLKVKTIAEIRKEYEEYVLSYLPEELQRQEAYLFRKIRQGSSKDDRTQTTVANLLKSKKPLSRSTWRMIARLNIESHPYYTQYIQWRGQNVRLNGSRGGDTSHIKWYDDTNLKHTQSCNAVCSLSKKSRICLLQKSLNVTYKPGPLSKKPDLDESFQKFHIGNSMLVELPQIGLEVTPMRGSLDPSICRYLKQLRNENGKVTRDWANFAASSLCTIKNKELKIKPTTHLFKLKYENNQHRIIVRKYCETKEVSVNIQNFCVDYKQNNLDIKETPDVEEIKNILADLLNSVEISAIEDSLYSVDSSEPVLELPDVTENPVLKEKTQKKKYVKELKRLDITVIQLNGSSNDKGLMECTQAHCQLGCVCESLECKFHLSNHCGQVDCMFGCKCKFGQYTSYDEENPSFLPGLMNINNRHNYKLAKEEQKFHQTVVFNEDTPIVLGAKRRYTKVPRKFTDFTNESSKDKKKNRTRIPTIILSKLDMSNVEPWCMVHQLYKCFCKGTFTEAIEPYKLSYNINEYEEKWINMPRLRHARNKVSCLQPTKLPVAKSEINKTKIEEKKPDENLVTDSQLTVKNEKQILEFCSRTVPWQIDKRKSGYLVKERNENIKKQENNTHLKMKLKELQAKASNYKQPLNRTNLAKSGSTDQISKQNNYWIATSMKHEGASGILNYDKGSKFAKWLEKNYIIMKQQLKSNSFNLGLGAPENKKVVLFPWSVLIKRFTDKKNYFLTTRGEQHRLYLVVDKFNEQFQNCIDISEIPSKSLDQYPHTVQNIISNKLIPDCFVILYGRTNSWEVVGTVIKTADKSEHEPDQIINEEDATEERFDLCNIDTKTTSNIGFTKCKTDVRGDINRSLLKTKQETVTKNQEIVLKKQESISKNEEHASTKHEGISKKDDTDSTSDGSQDNPSLRSKWFVMSIENDFTEMRFFKRGFFVRYENILKSIEIAKCNCKTVRLSAQMSTDTPTGQPQFGIYAVPTVDKNCVFLGPYTLDEELGIETLSNNSIATSNKTRGVWLYTKNIDNAKIIENPLPYAAKITDSKNKTVLVANVQVSPNKTCVEIDHNKNQLKMRKIDAQIVGDENLNVSLLKISRPNVRPPNQSKEGNITYNTSTETLKPENLLMNSSSTKSLLKPVLISDKSPENPVRKIKPITIKRDNGFFKLDSSGTTILKTNVLRQDLVSPTKPLGFIQLQELNSKFESSAIGPPLLLNNLSPPKVPQSKETGLQILRPEQINKLHSNLSINLSQTQSSLLKQTTSELRNENKSILCEKSNDGHADKIRDNKNNFSSLSLWSKWKGSESKNTEIKSKIECKINDANDELVCISSDDEPPSPPTQVDKDVWIISKNVENLGHIKATQRPDKTISFIFPGFVESEFCQPEIAFSKICQVLSRKVIVPNTLKLEWDVVTHLKKDHLPLNEKYLQRDYVLTQSGLRHKSDFFGARSNEINAAILELGQILMPSETLESLQKWQLIIKAPEVILKLKADEHKLAEEKRALHKEIEKNKKRYLDLIQDLPDLQRQQLEIRLHKMSSPSLETICLDD